MLALLLAAATAASADHHLAFEIGLGGGGLAMESANVLMDDINRSAQGGTLDGAPAHLGHELHFDLALRWTTPWHVGLRTGLGIGGGFPTEKIGNETLTNWVALLEIPVVVSWSEEWLEGRLATQAGVGPDIVALTVNGWDCNGCNIHAEEVDPFVGYVFEAAGQWWFKPWFALGLSLDYRDAVGGPMHERNGTTQIGPHAPYQLDFSGARAVGTLDLRFF